MQGHVLFLITYSDLQESSSERKGGRHDFQFVYTNYSITICKHMLRQCLNFSALNKYS